MDRGRPCVGRGTADICFGSSHFQEGCDHSLKEVYRYGMSALTSLGLVTSRLKQ